MELNGWIKLERDTPIWEMGGVVHAYSQKLKRMTILEISDLGAWTYGSHIRMTEMEISHIMPISRFQPPAPDQKVFRNPLPVIVIIARSKDGIVLIRRAIPGYGFGKLAFPGGFQDEGETWQQAACREMLEETGIVLDPKKLKVVDVTTVENGTRNLIFVEHEGEVSSDSVHHDHEVFEVTFTKRSVELAFPAHTEMLARVAAA